MLHSSGVVVTNLEYLGVLRELQREAESRGTAHRDAGWAEAIIPMYPLDEQKYAYCWHCKKCSVVVVSRHDIVPSDQIPDIAK
ncbi:MAG: hypothetical protein LC118_06515, partial [Dehalococcoidia bacterium]|nr:hypothetical protein [Dehalococcoidia bacterium]